MKVMFQALRYRQLTLQPVECSHRTQLAVNNIELCLVCGGSNFQQERHRLLVPVHFGTFLTCSSLWFRKLRRVCSACLNADKRLKAQLVGSPPEVEEDTKSDVSEIQSQRTGSVLSGREESDTGGLDTADAHSESQPGTLCWAHCVVFFRS